MRTAKLLSMVDYILEIDKLTTSEFCSKYKVPPPKPFVGKFSMEPRQVNQRVEVMVNDILRIDGIKHKMFVDYAKFLSRPVTINSFIGDNPIFPDFQEKAVEGDPIFSKTIVHKSGFVNVFWFDYSVTGRWLPSHGVEKVEHIVRWGLDYNLDY